MIKALVDLEEEKVKLLVKNALDSGISPYDIIQKGLVEGMRRLGEFFSEGKIFLPHLVFGAEIMQEISKELEKHFEKSEKKQIAKVLIGTVEGDLHDLGKNLVSTMLSCAGFEVIDLGKDIPSKLFLEKIEEEKPQLLYLSALMTTTMVKQKEVIQNLKERKMREKVKVVVGGAPTSLKWAEKIGADGYGADAFEAVSIGRKLIGLE